MGYRINEDGSVSKDNNVLFCHKYGFADLPANAKFCPNCGAPLVSRGASYMSVTECRFNPHVINAGETCKLEWTGVRVKTIAIDGAMYSSNRDIFLAPEQSREYKVEFIGENGERLSETLSVIVRNPFIFGKDGKLMSDGSFKIDLRQVHRQAGAYMLYQTQWKWDVVTETRIVKAYVAADEKLEFVFHPNGYLKEINFYPNGKFVSDGKEDCFDSIMQILYGEVKRIKEGWFVNDEYWARAQFKACYAQYGVEDMTAEQWWKEHDLTFFRYCEKYKSVIDEAIGKANNFIDDKVWESGEYRWGDNWRY